MSKIYKVETTGAIVDGNPIGSTIELTKSSAEKLSAIGYVKILNEVKPKAKPKKKTQAKKASAPKKPAKKTAAKKSDKKE